MSTLDFSFKHPTAIQVSGPSGCGKTRLVLRILENQVIRAPETDEFPTRIIWVYSEWQPDYEAARTLYPHIEFVHGWQEGIYNAISPNQTNLLIVDDLMDEAGSSKSMKALFTKGVHHRNCTVLYLLQNMYNQGKSQRTASLNTHYNIVFRNARDMCQFRTLASQMFPGKFYWLLDAFDDATAKPFGYLVLDTHPRTTDDGERVLTGILPGEQLTYYAQKKEEDESINTGVQLSPPPPPPPSFHLSWANAKPKTTRKRSNEQSNTWPSPPTLTLSSSPYIKRRRE
jgi:hypothetical protein